jgi:hypothetical protein
MATITDYTIGDEIAYTLPDATPERRERLWHGRIEYIWVDTKCLKVTILDTGYEGLPELVRLEQVVSREAEHAKPRTIYIASSVSLFDTPAYEDIKALVASNYPQDILIFAKGLYAGSQEWLTKWPEVSKTVDVLLAFTHDGWIGRGVFTEMADIYEQGKPVYLVDPQGMHYQLTGIPVEIDHELQVIGNLAFQFDTSNWRKYVSVIINPDKQETEAIANNSQ